MTSNSPTACRRTFAALLISTLMCLAAGCTVSLGDLMLSEGSAGAAGGDGTSTTSDSTTTETVTDAPETDGSAGTAGVSDSATTAGMIPKPCSPWYQDCPPGEKCTIAPLLGPYETHLCVPAVDNPDRPGESCKVLNDNQDSCDKGAMCWGVDPPTLRGRCAPLCKGGPEAGLCDEPRVCTYIADGLLLCLNRCDPVVQDCLDDERCDNSGIGDFVCVPDAPGGAGLFEGCEGDLVCEKGLRCVSSVPPECEPLRTVGCCVPYCHTDAPNTCPGKMQACEELGDTPGVGLCTNP